MFIQSYDEISARNVELARQVRDLNNENKVLYEENKNLRYENEELSEVANKMVKIVLEKGQGTIVDRFDKIKELAEDYQSQN